MMRRFRIITEEGYIKSRNQTTQNPKEAATFSCQEKANKLAKECGKSAQVERFYRRP